MKIIRLSKLESADRVRLISRSNTLIEEYTGKAKDIIDDVKENGDKAIIDYMEKFDRVKLDSDRLEVSEKDFGIAEKKVSARLVRAMEHAIENLRRFHEKQMPKKIWFTEVEEGIKVGLQASPLARVGLYIPAGKGRFPSVVPMLGVPAKVAGVEETVMCTPPVDGFGDPATLVAAIKLILQMSLG